MLDDTFAVLRQILAAHSKRLIVIVDRPGDYQVASPTMQDRIGRPLAVGAVQTRKNYVSYHFMPVYALPGLLKSVSPELKKRMQGKSCFNFTTVDPDQLKELGELTRTGIAEYRDLKLPWTQPMKRTTKRASPPARR